MQERVYKIPLEDVTPSPCEGQGTPLWASSALNPAVFKFSEPYAISEMHALFSVSGLKYEKLIKKQTYMKTEVYKRYMKYFEYFCQI